MGFPCPQFKVKLVFFFFSFFTPSSDLHLDPFLEMKRYTYQIWKEFVVMHTKNEANFDKNKLKHAYIFHVTQLLSRLNKTGHRSILWFVGDECDYINNINLNTMLISWILNKLTFFCADFFYKCPYTWLSFKSTLVQQNQEQQQKNSPLASQRKVICEKDWACFIKLPKQSLYRTFTHPFSHFINKIQ